MSPLAQTATLLVQDPVEADGLRLNVGLANTPAEVRAAQRLRYQVFAEEMGARLDCAEPGIDADRFDPYCQHLLVRDLDRQRVVGCYRILTDSQAVAAGGYYSQGEFDVTRILALPGRIMEVGRTCVHPDYRTGAVITLLWSGLARYLVINGFDYLVGCASIPLRRGTQDAVAIYERLRGQHLAPEWQRVFPRVPLPPVHVAGSSAGAELAIPPLVKAYLRVGAKICGEPAWDRQFNVADLFILLSADGINRRYARHFLARAS